MRLRPLLTALVLMSAVGCGDDDPGEVPENRSPAAGGGGSTASSGGSTAVGGDLSSAGGDATDPGSGGASATGGVTSTAGSGATTSGASSGAGGEEPAPSCGDGAPSFDDPMDACRAWLADDNATAEAIGGCATLHDGVCGSLEQHFAGCEAEAIAVHECVIAGSCPATCTCDADGGLTCQHGCDDLVLAFVECADL